MDLNGVVWFILTTNTMTTTFDLFKKCIICFYFGRTVFKDELGLQFHHGIRACRIQGHLLIHAPSPKSVVGCDG